MSVPIKATLSRAKSAAHAMAIATLPQRRARPQRARPAMPAVLMPLYKRLAPLISDERLIVVLALFISVAAYAWYASNELTLGYSDALSRMLIARRVVASRTPGLAQLGTTWLPLHTIAMLPLVWNDFLFRSGIAGAIPSMAAYVAASLYLFRMAQFLFAARMAAWTCALAFMLNPSVIYMQATAMSEVPLLCAAVIAIYYMLRWARSYYAPDLVKSAAAVAVGTGIRYDGWALAAALAVVVVYLAWRRYGYRGAESWGILYGLLAFAGCVAWVIYNAVIFHDPLLFLFFGNEGHDTSYMAKFPSYHQPWLSFELYGYSVGAMVGWVTASLAVVGLAIFVFRHRLRHDSLPAYALLIPIAYHWLIFYMGMDTIFLPELGSSVYWNVRFGLELIPAVTLFVAYLVTVRRALVVVALAVTVVFAFVGATRETPFALREPLERSAYATTPKAEAQWFLDHYHGGDVLISYVPNPAVMFYMLEAIPDQNLITDANGGEFTHALDYPQLSVEWVIMEQNQTDNQIWVDLHNRQDWRYYFVLRRVMGTTAFYERIDSGSTGTTWQGNNPQASNAQQATAHFTVTRQRTSSVMSRGSA